MNWRQSVLAVAILAIPRVALACPVCFGASDSPLASAINMGVIMMLGVVAVMLGSFATFFIYLNRRAKMLAASERLEAKPYTGTILTTNPQEGTASC